MTGQTLPILRQLTTDEIKTLQYAGCHAEDWKMLQVSDNFDASRVAAAEFTGSNRLLNCSGHGGLFNVHIENCTIADNTLIRNAGLISNYDIGNNCIIENCTSIRMEGQSKFGNGVNVKVHNEAGGREVPIFEELNAQIAYIICFYRHYRNSCLTSQIADYIHNKYKTAERGQIGDNCILSGCGEIININIRQDCMVNGAIMLKNGTIGSNNNSSNTLREQTTIGNGVIAQNFIMLTGCNVHSSAIIENCFVGERVEIGKQFSAQDCLIFNNSQFFHGEACSIFAGPFTVSHHKSTLLIGGTFSFYNAGSGTNQSNHLYKSGPRHSGILERGCKTASGSYLMWPARAGAFSVILGKHCTHFDTTNLPFSYIIEKNGCSFIKPAINLTSYGTYRDINKWEKRDKRTNKFDIVDFKISSPYILQKLQNAINDLSKLKDTGLDNSSNIALLKDTVSPLPYKHLYITLKDLEKATYLYKLALDAISVEAAERFASLKGHDLQQIEQAIADYTSTCCQWADMAGMFIPAQKIKQMLDTLTDGDQIEQTKNCINHLKNSLSEWHGQATYTSDLVSTYMFLCGKNINSQEKFEKSIAEAKKSKQILEKLINVDQEAENLEFARIGFGIDGICDKEQDYTSTIQDIFGIKNDSKNV